MSRDPEKKAPPAPHAQSGPASALTIPIAVALIPFAVSILGLLSVIFWLHWPLYTGLLIGWLVAVVLALAYGRGGRLVAVGSYQGARNTFFVIGILLMIAGVISAWFLSGTVPALIYYGLQLIQPTYLVVTAFLLAAGTSMVLGTSVGTLSTMGTAVAGMGVVYGIDPALIGGALISGAMVGDRTSPVSGSFHLVATMTGTRAEDNYKPMWQTGLPMFLLCIVLFGWLGYGLSANSPQETDALNSPMLRTITTHFQLPWYVMLPPLLVLVLAALRMPILRNLSLGILFGAVLAVVTQQATLPDVLGSVWFGYDLESVLHGGGIWPMFHQVLLILMAGALTGVLESSGMMSAIFDGLLTKIHDTRNLIFTTLLISIIMAGVACNQALSIIVPGRALRPTYDRLGVSPKILVRSLADSGVVVSPLIPWNLHGILCSTAIGIATTTYFPYAIFLWGLPLLTFSLSFRHKNKRNSDKLDKLLQ
ncbi:Na+/H+ antiporter NhaC family protein [Tumebacillus permanentifrigoris]|uniref:Transporter (NhaC family) n=1 Tax=Tumebacillus permanentifrigoris TaxID=378543 RepID=A0A316DH48_9BACL|nr:Na+/H+ antiporter NhaC family protein [Tumebacillus permanentifrigoris]PWK15903.1 transporter (NhaC family) [Tumebacillus permanentifrigoris]